jgi:hypothetical protein
MEQDRFGLPLGTESAEAAEAYREGIDLLLAAWGGADRAFERALAAAPAFTAAALGLARVRAIAGRIPEARALVTAAARPRGSLREEGQRAVLEHALHGRTREAIAAAEAHLDTWPRDGFVLSLLLGAFGLLAFSGRSDHNEARVALCGRLAGQYPDDWWFLGFHGWALTEAGDLDAGEPLIERSLALRWANGDAAHMHAHVHHDRRRHAAGAAFVEGSCPSITARGGSTATLPGTSPCSRSTAATPRARG